MEVSIEGFFLINLCMDLLTIAVIARSRGRIRWARVTAAALLGAFWATAAQLPASGWMSRLPGQILLSLLLSAIALPSHSGTSLLRGAGSLLAGALFLGGVQFFISRRLVHMPPLAFALSACCGLSALIFLSGERRKRLFSWEVQVYAATFRGDTRFRALVDTGNRLREPFSGLPVMIVEETLLRDLLPPGFDAGSAAQNIPPGFRAVAYGALGGSGQLACFQPQQLFVSFGDGYIRAPDVWIAVYPGRMTGSVRALAPPILGCVETRAARQSIL